MLRYLYCEKQVSAGGVSTKAKALEKKKGDAGYDLEALRAYTLKPGQRLAVPTGLKVAIPEGYYAQIFPRSGLALQGIDTTGGVIDASYRGEIKVILKNNTDKDYEVLPYQRIAQLVVIKIFTGEVQRVEELEETERGEKGFGSSGKFGKNKKEKNQ